MERFCVLLSQIVMLGVIGRSVKRCLTVVSRWGRRLFVTVGTDLAMTVSVGLSNAREP
jgi:hypothetical protein